MKEQKMIFKLIWDSLPTLKTLLQIKMSWSVAEVNAEIAGTKSSQDDDGNSTATIDSAVLSAFSFPHEKDLSSKAAKKQCGIRILKDWVQAFGDIENYYNHCKVSELDDPEDIATSLLLD